jgi:hypothetical protein
MDTQAFISQAYSAFNKRDVEGTLALMIEDVNWPKASEGGRVVGKQAIREYWSRQWSEFDPLLEVLEVIDRENGRTEVKVHQLVKNLKGEVLSDTELWHIYTIQDDLIARMDLWEADGSVGGRPSAFAGHGG